ncbi:MAG: hypothetical protein KBS59_05355, partial [Clostridiales bacterium]|nr:hypothetical protein [Clostridiales bacterium]
KLPLENPDESCRDYWSIDYNARGTVQPVDLTLCATVKFIDGGVELGVKTLGCGNVPLKLEFAINEGLLCEVGNAAMITKAGADVFSRSGDACFRSRGGTVMTVDGLFCKHIYAENMRGSLDPDPHAFTLYATDFTNLDRKVTIKFKKATGAHVFY